MLGNFVIHVGLIELHHTETSIGSVLRDMVVTNEKESIFAVVETKLEVLTCKSKYVVIFVRNKKSKHSFCRLVNAPVALSAIVFRQAQRVTLCRTNYFRFTIKSREDVGDYGKARLHHIRVRSSYPQRRGQQFLCII